jgi:hypothetical protein
MNNEQRIMNNVSPFGGRGACSPFGGWWACFPLNHPLPPPKEGNSIPNLPAKGECFSLLLRRQPGVAIPLLWRGQGVVKTMKNIINHTARRRLSATQRLPLRGSGGSIPLLWRGQGVVQTMKNNLAHTARRRIAATQRLPLRRVMNGEWRTESE